MEIILPGQGPVDSIAGNMDISFVMFPPFHVQPPPEIEFYLFKGGTVYGSGSKLIGIGNVIWVVAVQIITIYIIAGMA